MPAFHSEQFDGIRDMSEIGQVDFVVSDYAT